MQQEYRTAYGCPSIPLTSKYLCLDGVGWPLPTPTSSEVQKSSFLLCDPPLVEPKGRGGRGDFCTTCMPKETGLLHAAEIGAPSTSAVHSAERSSTSSHTADSVSRRCRTSKAKIWSLSPSKVVRDLVERHNSCNHLYLSACPPHQPIRLSGRPPAGGGRVNRPAPTPHQT
jgi:hypothetical protein